MKHPTQTFALILAFFLVGMFWWGFAGFVASGSSGSPPEGRLLAFWIGGIGYLALLLFSYSLGLTAADDSNRKFGASAGINLLWTIIALMACFPAAIFFIGFLAPPFILTVSAFAFAMSAPRTDEATEDDR